MLFFLESLILFIVKFFKYKLITNIFPKMPIIGS